MEINNEMTTKLQSIHIKGLFDMFDYDIEFAENENVLILTGANGFGKTQILNIIYNLFNKNFNFFDKLVFSEIKLFLSENIQIVINKNDKKQTNYMFFKDYQNIGEIYSGWLSSINITNNVNKIQELERLLPIEKIDNNRWHDFRTGHILTDTELLNTFIDEIPSRFLTSKPILKRNSLYVLNSLDTHLIEEQRLFKFYEVDEVKTNVEKTVEIYSYELSGLIYDVFDDFIEESQKLDNTYVKRLMKASNQVSKNEYIKKQKNISHKINRLKKNGLYEVTSDIFNYEELNYEYETSDLKALSVYLNDLEKKLSVFDDLLEKLELFTTILNERRFTFKSIVIDKDEGFYIQTKKGKRLQLEDLSSGEKHELVLLYELIFKTDKNTLVLIDEPEISLHITWQKEFVKDLLKIIEIQGFQAIIATHAPAIINDRWDLVYTLEKSKSV